MGRHVQRSVLAAAIVGSAVASVPTGMPLSVTTFTAYPGYTGNLTVTGKVSIGHASETMQVLWFRLHGTDPNCTTGTRTAANNACGIHIHAGTSCDSAGGHYYSSNLTSDPWLDVVYSSHSEWGQNVFVETGLTNAAIGGHVVVVHDCEGNRVACAMISAHVTMSPQGYAKSFVDYRGYTGSKTARGEVRVAQLGSGADGSQALAFDLTGADSACVPTASISGVNNACGIHIHHGLRQSSSCDEADFIGGHLMFGRRAEFAATWEKIRYFVVDGATTGLTTLVTTGADWAYVRGRVVVLHDVSGTPIACSVITGAGTSAVSAASMRSPLVWTLAAAAMALRAAM